MNQMVMKNPFFDKEISVNHKVSGEPKKAKGGRLSLGALSVTPCRRNQNARSPAKEPGVSCV